jgi:hypothetical protein
MFTAGASAFIFPRPDMEITRNTAGDYIGVQLTRGEGGRPGIAFCCRG